MLRPPARSTLFPYTTLFRSRRQPERARGRRTAATPARHRPRSPGGIATRAVHRERAVVSGDGRAGAPGTRSEEHTSELQSHSDLVCRLLLEKKNSTASAAVS